MVRPGVELERGLLLREQLCELARRLGLLCARSGRGTCHGHARRSRRPRRATGVAELDPCVGGAEDASRRSPAPTGLPFESYCGREELAEVRLVPDREVADERVAVVPSRVTATRAPARSSGGRSSGRRVVLALATVRPRRRAPDRQHDLHPVQPGVPDELVEVVEAVGRIEGIGARSRAWSPRCATSRRSCARFRRPACWARSHRRPGGRLASAGSGRPGSRSASGAGPTRGREERRRRQAKSTREKAQSHEETPWVSGRARGRLATACAGNASGFLHALYHGGKPWCSGGGWNSF